MLWPEAYKLKQSLGKVCIAGSLITGVLSVWGSPLAKSRATVVGHMHTEFWSNNWNDLKLSWQVRVDLVA